MYIYMNFYDSEIAHVESRSFENSLRRVSVLLFLMIIRESNSPTGMTIHLCCILHHQYVLKIRFSLFLFNNFLKNIGF